MSGRTQQPSERGQLDLFHALPGVVAPRDAQDLMAYPFFSLAKSRRIAPIDFRAGDVAIRVEAMPDHGMATIWDADILIWAASQIVSARDVGLRTSRLMAATPYEMLTFVGRGVSKRDYLRLKAALDRLQSTSVVTSIRQPAEGRRHRFSWINEWQEHFDRNGRPLGVELILPDWFYRAVMVDTMGQVQATAPAIADYKPTDPQIAWHLARFVEQVRSIPADPIILRQDWLRAYDWTTDQGAAALNDYARANDPFSRVGKQQVAVDISSVIRASPGSFRVAWIEHHYENGQLSGTERWTAILTIVTQMPNDAERLRANPLGIYVNAINWSREMSQ